MSLLTWSMSALTAAVLAWQAALPAPRVEAGPRAAPTTSEDALLARVEREVTQTLRVQHSDRWRFSRVHRPTQAFRTTADPQRSTREFAHFRIHVAAPLGRQSEVLGYLVRIKRSSGALEVAAASEGTEKVAPAWAPFVPRAAMLAPPYERTGR